MCYIYVYFDLSLDCSVCSFSIIAPIPLLWQSAPICPRLHFPLNTMLQQPSLSPVIPQDLWFFRSSCFPFTYVAYPGVGLGEGSGNPASLPSTVRSLN